MTATLSQSQAELPKLVELASRSEDVVITVEGKLKARLTRTGADVPRPFDGRKWITELEELNRRHNSGKNGISVEQILAKDQEDRL